VDDTDYALGRTNTEYERLIEQAELMRPLTERTLRAAGIAAGMRVLDIGCGMGDVSFLVADIVGPQGSVVGVDLDVSVLHLADQRRAARGLENILFLEGDARSVDSEGLFDAAVGRFVLMYMKDPTAALRLIAQPLRPGGIIAFHEWVAGISPASAMNLPSLASFQDLISTTFERSGARLNIGAELYRRMQEAGLEGEPRPLAEVACCIGQPEVAYRRWASFAQSMLPKIVQYGVAVEQDVMDLLDRLRREIFDAPGLLPLSWFMVGQWARKPPQPGSAV